MNLIERNYCPGCKKQKFLKLFELSYSSKLIVKFLDEYYEKKIPHNVIRDKSYELDECQSCTMIFQKFIPDELFSYELYENIISKEKSLKKKTDNPNLNIVYDKELNLIKKISKKKEIKILDFGAGWGFWSKRALDSGFSVDSFELSKSRIDYMKKNNLNIINDLNKTDTLYDIIYSDQTLEHIPEPNKFFEDLTPKLSRDGYFMLNFPSSYNFKKNLNINYIPNKDAAHPLEHINILNRQSIKKILEQHDLKLINFKWSKELNLKNILKDFKNLIYFDNILIKKKN